jgi:hypothetical protein
MCSATVHERSSPAIALCVGAHLPGLLDALRSR